MSRVAVVRVEPSRMEALVARLGHEVQVRKDYDIFFGGVQALQVHPDGTLVGAADPRRDGAAVSGDPEHAPGCQPGLSPGRERHHALSLSGRPRLHRRG